MFQENVAAARHKIAQTVKPHILVFEFFGTALLVYGYQVSNKATIAFPLAYFMGWMLSYHITGAEFNPAISLASFIVNKQWHKGKQLAFTIIA
jgi:glycerol uptake facilitator-like aquaporin